MQEPIRVAQIMGKLWAGGVEMVVFNYYRAIDKSKVQFDFYYDADSTVEPPQELIDMGARFYKIPPYQKLPSYLRTLRRYFEDNNYQIVHSHINTLSVFPLFVAWSCGIPTRIAHNHSVPGGNEVKRNLLKYFLRLFAKVFSTEYFACSEKAGQWMFGNGVIADEHFRIIRNAINFNRFSNNFSDRELRKLIAGRKVVGHVGRFTYAKNHDFLLDVFKMANETEPNTILLLVGDGELHDHILEKILEYKLKDKVFLIGKTDKPELYYPLMDVFVFPSVFEGVPLTVVEAQLSGVPVIVSEAVTEEIDISNGFHKIKLSDGKKVWCKKILELLDSPKNIVLNDRCNEYNICTEAPKLEKWYINKCISSDI